MRNLRSMKSTIFTFTASLTIFNFSACKSQEEVKAEAGREIQAALANNDLERFGKALAKFRRRWRDDANEVFYLDAGEKNLARTLLIQGKTDYMQSVVKDGRVPAANWVSYVEKPEEFKYVFAINPDWEKDEPGVERVNGLWAVAPFGDENQVDQIYKKHPRLYTRYADLGKDSLEYFLAQYHDTPGFDYFFKRGLISKAALILAIGRANCEETSAYLKYVTIDLMDEGYPVFAGCAAKHPKLFTQFKIADRKKLANIIDKEGENLLFVYLRWLAVADPVDGYHETLLKAILAATENFHLRNHAGEDIDALLPAICNRQELSKRAQAKHPFCRAADLIMQAKQGSVQ